MLYIGCISYYFSVLVQPPLIQTECQHFFLRLQLLNWSLASITHNLTHMWHCTNQTKPKSAWMFWYVCVCHIKPDSLSVCDLWKNADPALLCHVTCGSEQNMLDWHFRDYHPMLYITQHIQIHITHSHTNLIENTSLCVIVICQCNRCIKK